MKLLKSCLLFINDLFANRRMLYDLTKNDFKQDYLGSFFGIVWAFIQPSIIIILYWFIFQVGFKTKPVDNFPFILWLMIGLVPWLFFAESWAKSTQSVTSYSYLVNKVVFKVSLLPIIKINSSLLIHLFFIGIVFILMLVYGYRLDFYSLQIFYYLACLLVLLLGLSLFTSALQVFFKDTAQIIQIFLQVGFWLSPILYSQKIFSPKVQSILQLNPFFYIINGYRDSLIYKIGFWQHADLTLYYWSFTILVLVFGSMFFMRLRPHFADVL